MFKFLTPSSSTTTGNGRTSARLAASRVAADEDDDFMLNMRVSKTPASASSSSGAAALASDRAAIEARLDEIKRTKLARDKAVSKEHARQRELDEDFNNEGLAASDLEQIAKIDKLLAAKMEEAEVTFQEGYVQTVAVAYPRRNSMDAKIAEVAGLESFVQVQFPDKLDKILKLLLLSDADTAAKACGVLHVIAHGHLEAYFDPPRSAPASAASFGAWRLRVSHLLLGLRPPETCRVLADAPSVARAQRPCKFVFRAVRLLVDAGVAQPEEFVPMAVALLRRAQDPTCGGDEVTGLRPLLARLVEPAGNAQAFLEQALALVPSEFDASGHPRLPVALRLAGMLPDPVQSRFLEQCVLRGLWQLDAAAAAADPLYLVAMKRLEQDLLRDAAASPVVFLKWFYVAQVIDLLMRAELRQKGGAKVAPDFQRALESLKLLQSLVPQKMNVPCCLLVARLQVMTDSVEVFAQPRTVGVMAVITAADVGGEAQAGGDQEEEDGL